MLNIYSYLRHFCTIITVVWGSRYVDANVTISYMHKKTRHEDNFTKCQMTRVPVFVLACVHPAVSVYSMCVTACTWLYMQPVGDLTLFRQNKTH